MRIKRRNRLLDFEDDESDEEDEDAKRRRQRMAKKRKIEGDTLEQLGTWHTFTLYSLTDGLPQLIIRIPNPLSKPTITMRTKMSLLTSRTRA